MLKPLFRSLRSILPSGAVLAVAPDHPLMLDDAQAFVGHCGHGLAILSARRGEDDHVVSARLLACRLTMPRHWVHAFVYRGTSCPALLEERFDICLDGHAPDTPARLLQALGEDAPSSRERTMLREEAEHAAAALETGLARGQLAAGGSLDAEAARAVLPQGSLVFAADLRDGEAARKAWLAAVASAYAWQGRRIVPSSAPPPVVLVTGWPEGYEGGRIGGLFARLGVFAVAADTEADLLSAVGLPDPLSQGPERR